MSRVLRSLLPILTVLVLPASLALARPESPLSGQQRAEIDRIAREVLAATGAPSASVAVVRDGQIAYLSAYGQARLSPATPARTDMRYSIGSISKQFTATAVLMLAEEGKLSLDDPVARFLPSLTRAGDVTVRQVLSHTSGYRDYWPQDYVLPFMLQEITAEKILDGWARKPLDFEPGSQYQYSNTGYVIAGLIVEKASGTPLLSFLAKRVFTPLGMESVADIDRQPQPETDPVGYLRYGLGPLRVAPKEGKGWLFAAGELAMTPKDLARWNIGLIDQRLLKPASYREMETEVWLSDGVGTDYGLGIDVRMEDGRRVLEHGGEVSGFSANNKVFPDERAAVTVLTNLDATEAAGSIAKKIVPVLFENRDSTAASEARARRIFEGLQQGRIDRSLLTANAASYFTEEAMRDFSASLSPLGSPRTFKQARRRDRGGMTLRVFEVKFSAKSLEIWERDMPDGKIEQYQVMATD